MKQKIVIVLLILQITISAINLDSLSTTTKDPTVLKGLFLDTRTEVIVHESNDDLVKTSVTTPLVEDKEVENIKKRNKLRKTRSNGGCGSSCIEASAIAGGVILILTILLAIEMDGQSLIG